MLRASLADVVGRGDSCSGRNQQQLGHSSSTCGLARCCSHECVVCAAYRVTTLLVVVWDGVLMADVVVGVVGTRSSRLLVN
jgi:hypothetical protein